MRFSRVLAAACVPLTSLAVAATAVAAPPSLTVSQLHLDAQSQGSLAHTPAVATARLHKGRLYVATVQGTVSYYAAIDYTAPQAPFIAFCGRPLAEPEFPSAGGAGMVGNDAQFIFAQPITSGTCAADTLPRTWLNFQADNGFGWAHPALLSAHPLSRPLPSHTYDYAFVGQNRPLRFELDDPDTRDDYGSLHITVRRAVRSDCTGAKWKAFGVKTRDVCLGETAHTVGVVPRISPVKELAVPLSPVLRVVRDSDFPASHNVELPSGALNATQYARYDLGFGAPATRWASTLTSAGLRSAAISESAGLGAPDVKSTAVLLRTAAGARKVLVDEIAQARANVPAGDTVSIAADPAVAGATLVTYSPAPAPGDGGFELLQRTGTSVLDLRELENPSTLVSRTQVESLATTLAAR
jgi:hypothetical protein